MKSPIAIFAFNRPQALQHLLADLCQCLLAEESDVFVFIDGPRHEKDAESVKQTVSVAQTFVDRNKEEKLFRSINIVESQQNKGLAASVISGVTEIIESYGRVIVLEDDLRLSPNLLVYMNQMLEKYEHEPKVFQIAGYGLKVTPPKDYSADIYFHTRSTSWGWATWRDRWETVDWKVRDFAALRRSPLRRWRFRRLGSDVFAMLKGWHEGRNNSWAIRFTYSMFKQNRLAVTPIHSLTANEGFGEDATNCKDGDHYLISKDNGTRQSFRVPQEVKVCKSLSEQAVSYFSLRARFLNGKRWQSVKRRFQLQDWLIKTVALPMPRSKFVIKWAIKLTSETEKLANVILPWWFKRVSPPHGKTSDVIISLTSIPVRLPRLWLVVECLLRGTVRPEKVVLYLSRQQVPDINAVPTSLLQYKGFLDIRFVDGDIRSHKKYWYALTDFPDRHLLVIDDDIIYDSRLLERALQCHQQCPQAVVANYFHRIQRDATGKPLPYLTWTNDIRRFEVSNDIFFGSGGGTFYPAGSLEGANIDAETLLHICPLADDVWQNAIVRKNGFTIMAATNSRLRVAEWLIKDNQRLAHTNSAEHNKDDKSYNDEQIDSVTQFLVLGF